MSAAAGLLHQQLGRSSPLYSSAPVLFHVHSIQQRLQSSAEGQMDGPARAVQLVGQGHRDQEQHTECCAGSQVQ
jgi:hypothetical protein